MTICYTPKILILFKYTENVHDATPTVTLIFHPHFAQRFRGMIPTKANCRKLEI